MCYVLGDFDDHEEENTFTIKDMECETLEVVETNPQPIEVLSLFCKAIVLENIKSKHLSICVHKPVIIMNSSCENIEIEAFKSIEMNNINCGDVILIAKDIVINDSSCNILRIDIPTEINRSLYSRDFNPNTSKIKTMNSHIHGLFIGNLNQEERNTTLKVKLFNMFIDEIQMNIKFIKTIIDANREIKVRNLFLDVFSLVMNKQTRDIFDIHSMRDCMRLICNRDELIDMLSYK